MEIGHVNAGHGTLDLGVVPGNREENRRVQQIAEVIRVMGVLPDVVGVHHQEFAERLLEAGMKFVALSRRNRRRSALSEERAQDRIADRAGHNQVFVKRSLQYARVRDAQYGIRSLDVVCHARAGFRLPGAGETAIDVEPHAEVEGPGPLRDRILDIPGELFDICAASEAEQAGSWSWTPIARRRCACEVEAAKQGHERSRRVGIGGNIRFKAGSSTVYGIVDRGVAGRNEASRNVLRNARIIDRRIGQAKRELFAKKCVLEQRPHLQVVNSFYIGDVAANAGIGECPLLRGRFGQIGERIPAGIKVERIMPHERTQSKQSALAEKMCPARSKVVSPDLRALVLSDSLLIKGVRFLEPGAGKVAVQMDRIGIPELKVNAIEYVLFIALGMHDLELRRIKKSSGIQAADRDKIAKLLVPGSQREAARVRPEGTIRVSYAPRRFRLTQS